MEIRTERPARVRPPMEVTERAKQFAPYAALGSMDGVLKKVVEGRDVGDYVREETLEDFEYMCAEDIDAIKWEEE